MTRKEVCKATGLSVKTLRLYEEKGLIAPAKERRGGREYRVYTPQLVAQLEQIALLRRALFTMDEIRTMQEHPEVIPDIFHSYRQWLAHQEQQFRLLRQAADSIRPDDLGSMDGLLSGLRGAAAHMPLPATDIKPNFKRLDEIEEAPRHVEAQVDFDETVPNARVFRQMNLVMDGDRTNNINLAFGQYNALRRGQTEASGPVRREYAAPKWLRALSGIVTGLVLVGFALCIASFAHLFWMPCVSALWNVTCILFLVRLALAAIPMWLEHRSWLKTARQEDFQRQQNRSDPDFGGYQKERRRRIAIALLAVAGAAVLVALTVLLARVIYEQEHPDTDFRVCFVSPATVSGKDLRSMDAVLSPLVGDRDGNGKAVTTVALEEIRWYTTYHTPDRGDLFSLDYLNYQMQQGQYPLFFIANLAIDDHNLCSRFDFSEYCRALPEDLAEDSKDFSAPYRADLSGTAVFASAGLEDLPAYGCIPRTASDEDYALAVELLRKILAE